MPRSSSQQVLDRARVATVMFAALDDVILTWAPVVYLLIGVAAAAIIVYFVRRGRHE